MTEQAAAWRRPGPRHPQSLRTEDALWEAYKAEAEKLGLTRNELANEALERMLGWDPSGPVHLRSLRWETQAAAERPAAPSASDGPPKPGAAPVAHAEPYANGSAPARRVARTRKAASEPVTVPAGTAVFQVPGSEPVVTVPAPPPADHSAKSGRTGAKRCPHRLPAGAWCKTCETSK